MNIIITRSFKKDFTKIFKENDLISFCKNISLWKEINLEHPYKKYKFNISWIAIRGVYVISIKNFLLPIFIIKKFDKKYWMNLVLTKELINILNLKYSKSLDDIENKSYSLYNEIWLTG